VTPAQQLALLRDVSRSFYLSIRLLPPGLREPVAVAYLLARASDTIADTSALPAGQRLTDLELLVRAIEGDAAARSGIAALAARPPAPGVDAGEQRLLHTLPQCLAWLDGLQPDDRADVHTVLRKITEGQALDLRHFGTDGQLRSLATAPELDTYTYLVAGCVGEFWTALCLRHLPDFATLPRDEMLALGRNYGMGLQLVNILRDAREDIAAGRSYLPQDEIDAATLEQVHRHWRNEAARRLEGGMAYALAVNSRRVRAASALPALLGARTLALMAQYDPLRQRVKVPRSEVRALLLRLVLGLAGRASLQAAFRSAGRVAGDGTIAP